MKHLRQSTASQTITIGPFIDDTDFKTTENALTIANTDIKLKKNGATAVNKNSGGGTNDVNGMVAITLDATDTNTVGELNISVKVAGALVVFKDCEVLEEPVYDLKYGSGATGQVPLQDNAITAAKIAGNAFVAANFAAGSLDGKGNWNIGKTGYSLTQAFPSNFADLSISVTTGLVDITQAAADKVWSTAARTLTALPSIPANWITSAGINNGAFTDVKFGADFITAAKIAPDAGNQIAAHVWRITGANVEADGSADTIANGTPSAFMGFCSNTYQYDVVSSDIVYKNNAGTSIGKRAITTNANTQIVTIAKLIAA